MSSLFFSDQWNEFWTGEDEDAEEMTHYYSYVVGDFLLLIHFKTKCINFCLITSYYFLAGKLGLKEKLTTLTWNSKSS